MLLILRSRAAFSLLSGSFGSLRFFSLGTSLSARLAMTDRRLHHPAAPPPLAPEFFETDEDPCANASAPPIRATSAIERIVVRILVLPFCILLSCRNVDRCAIAASLAGAVLRLSHIGHGAEQPEFRRPPAPRRSRASRRFRFRDCPHLPAAPVSPRRPPSSLRSRLWRVEVNVAAIVDNTILQFRG